MKLFISLALFVLTVAILGNVHAFFFLGGMQSQNNNNVAQRICIINANAANCSASGPAVCGRFGSSNLCMNFQNFCSLQAANCQQTTQYTQVSANLCSNIGVNSRGQCSDSATSTNIPGNSGVIIIRRRRFG